MTLESAFASIDDNPFDTQVPLSGSAEQHDVALSSGGLTDNPSNSENAALQRQATQLQHLLRVLPAGVIVIDGKGIVRQANDQARQLLGEPLEGQVWRAIIVRAFKPRADDGHEVSLHDGRRVKLSISPLLDEPGQLIVLTDLTETRQLQDRISHMQRLSALGKMVASLAHQIRTPLSSAILYAANLRSAGHDNAVREKFTDKLVARLQDLEHQVNDMLLFAKSGEQQVVTPIQLIELLQASVSSMEELAEAQHADIHITRQPDATASVFVLGNRTALLGALQNLLHNALQLGQDNPAITITTEGTDSDTVCINIEDNGPGIQEEQKHRLFEPFFTTRTQGTGLGLAVVKQVARSHGGDVAVTNLPSGGARFTIQMPRHHSNQSDTESPASTEAYTTGGNA